MSVGVTPNNIPQNVGVSSETVQKSAFGDVSSDHWAFKFIEYANTKEIMSCDDNGTFRPNDFITREEFLKTVMTAMGVDLETKVAPGVGVYQDVAADAWYNKYVRVASSMGVINGVDENNFGAGIPLTRQDAAVIIVRIKEAVGMVFTETEKAKDFADGEAIADYAKDSVAKLQKWGILGGDENGAFAPSDSLTRAQTAKIIYSILKNIKSL